MRKPIIMPPARQAPWGLRAAAGVAALGAGLALPLGHAGFAAQEAGGASGTLSLGVQAVSRDGTLSALMPLSLGLQSATRSQMLEFRLSAPVEADRDGLRLDEPSARLFWRHESRQSLIETELSHRETTVSQQNLDEITDLPVIDDGTLRDSRARLGLAFGRESKFGGTLDLSQGWRRYSDTLDPSLIDSTTQRADGRLTFQLTPRLAARALAGWTRTEADPGGTDSVTRQAGVGLGVEIDPATTADLALMRTHIRRESPTEIEQSRGNDLTVKLTRARPDGAWTLNLDSLSGTGGRRDSLRIGRSFETARSTLAAEGGLTRLAGGDPDPLYRISYSAEPMRGASLGLSLGQRAVTATDGEEALVSDVSANWKQELGPVSAVSAQLGLSRTDVTQGDTEDSRRASLSLSYDHALSKDWTLSTGYNGLRSRTSGGKRDDEDRVFIGLGKTWQWRP